MEFIREAAAGSPIKESCWNEFVSCAMFRAWTAQYRKANVAAIDRLKQLELENARLKKGLVQGTGTSSACVRNRPARRVLPRG